MQNVKLKLKQASAVLGVSPKDLQNLVQFGVLRPAQRNRVCWFDTGLLLQAKVAFYLKDSLGFRHLARADGVLWRGERLYLRAASRL